MKQLFLLITLVFVFMSSCSNTNTPLVSDVDPLIEISHFDHRFFAMDSSEFDNELLKLKKDFPTFFKIGEDDLRFKNRFFDPQIRELYDAMDSIYGSTTTLETKLTKAFKYFYHYFPNQDSLKIYTWISNFENLEPIMISDNTLLIALDMYLGDTSRFYKTAPEYIRQSFNEKYIVSHVFHSYFRANVPLLKNSSLLSSMLHYGKIHYLSSFMLPNAEQEIIMTYPTAKMDWCVSNESNVWAYFIENKLLYSTSYQNKQRFIDDAPFSKFYTNFDTETPGKIGQWIGWKIVESYMDANPEISLTELITEQDAQKILRESHYKPK